MDTGVNDDGGGVEEHDEDEESFKLDINLEINMFKIKNN